MKIGSLGVPWATPGPILAQISIFNVFAPILRRSWVPLGVHFGVVFGGLGDFLTIWVVKFAVWVPGLCFQRFESENDARIRR